MQGEWGRMIASGYLVVINEFIIVTNKDFK